MLYFYVFLKLKFRFFGGGGGSNGFFDFFGGRSGKPRTSDAKFQFRVNLEDVYKGAELKVSLITAIFGYIYYSYFCL